MNFWYLPWYFCSFLVLYAPNAIIILIIITTPYVNTVIFIIDMVVMCEYAYG